MLESIKIQNFKRFRDLSISRLKRVNLIAGKNNTGKTGLLEAILCLVEPFSFFNEFPRAFRPCENIGDAIQNLWEWLFHNKDVSRPIILESETDFCAGYAVALTRHGAPVPDGFRPHGQGQSGIVVSFRSSKIKQTGSIANATSLPEGVVALSDRPSEPQRVAGDYDRLVLKPGAEERIEGLLRKLEPRLVNIRSIRPHGAPLLYASVGLSERIPAVHLGQGFSRLLSIYAEIMASGKKIVLIDEFESGLHYSVLKEIWKGVLNLTEQEGVQIFATTHSYECIRAAHAAFSETLNYDFALHRLEEIKGDIAVTSYDRDTLETSLASNFEIR
jgi:ABC-type transport system involved in cytochrome c biogenesis ATPase subunit